MRGLRRSADSRPPSGSGRRSTTVGAGRSPSTYSPERWSSPTRSGPLCHDECVGPLFAGAAAWLWAGTAPLVIVASHSEPRELRVLAWLVPLICPPVAWAFALVLFALFPRLGGP